MTSNPQIYIRGFSKNTRQKDLQAIFQKFGTIKQARILNGYAFIGFQTEDIVNQAIKQMNGTDFEGSRLTVQLAGQKKKTKGPQPSDECRYCYKLGHWKNSCPDYKRRSGKDDRRRRYRSSSSDSSSSDDRRKKKKRSRRRSPSADSSSSSSRSSSSSSRSHEKRKKSKKSKNDGSKKEE